MWKWWPRLCDRGSTTRNRTQSKGGDDSCSHSAIAMKTYMFTRINVCFPRRCIQNMIKYLVCDANWFKIYGNSQMPVCIPRHSLLIPGLLRWSHLNKSTNGKMHEVHDSQAWHAIDTKFPSFGRGFLNICMTLSRDGFNPSSSFLCQWSLGQYLYLYISCLLGWPQNIFSSFSS